MSEIAEIQGYDIRDKKLADATSASAVASTDAIRMKTTTGDDVYIYRDSFVGAIASVFKANNSSDVTSLFGELTANNESSPCSINMSNLASVLSAILPFRVLRVYPVPGDTTIDIPLGYGIVIVIISSIGTLGVYSVANMNVQDISTIGEQSFSITKPSEYITRVSSQYSVTVITIGYIISQ